MAAGLVTPCIGLHHGSGAELYQGNRVSSQGQLRQLQAWARCWLSVSEPSGGMHDAISSASAGEAPE